METPEFSSAEAEIQHWKRQAEEYKDKYVETKEELDEFQMSSRELEAELEGELERTENKIKELSSVKCRLEMENESLKERLESLQSTSHKQITELEDNLAQTTGQKDELVKYIRELEQINDDLERAKRATVVSLEDFESRLNMVLERNAFLESELDDKESLVVTVQRLKDEARDLRQEMAVRCKPDESPVKTKNTDVDRIENTAHSPVVDSNKLAEELGSIAQTPGKTPSLLNHNGTSGTPLTPSARISALNIVGDLLRKVGALENKLASCRNYVNNQQPRNSKGSPVNSPRAKRLHRGGSGSLQSESSSVTPRPSSANQQGLVNVKITI